MRHVISVQVENKFGVLARIAGLFSGRGFNIETLNVGPTHVDGRSRITATLNGDEKSLDQCIKQLDKLIDVIDIQNFIGSESVGRELVMVKVKANSSNRCHSVKSQWRTAGYIPSKSAGQTEIQKQHSRLNQKWVVGSGQTQFEAENALKCKREARFKQNKEKQQ